MLLGLLVFSCGKTENPEKKESGTKTEAAKKEKEKAAKKSDKKTTTSSGVKRKADGKVDLRTKEGKAIAERMEKARKAKEKNKKKGGVLSRLIKKLV